MKFFLMENISVSKKNITILLGFFDFFLFLRHQNCCSMKRRIITTAVLLLSGLFSIAQDSTQGMEFWFSYMENGYKYNAGNWVENNVMVSAKRACTGTISTPDGSLSPLPFSVGDNGITYVEIPEEYAYNEDNSEVVDRKSLVLRATDTVSVYISNVATYSFDASFVLPVESLGSEYIVQCDKQSTTYHNGTMGDGIETSAFLIIAVEDNTVVDISPTAITEHDIVYPGGIYTINLNAGETYFVKSNSYLDERDLSGTVIMARNNKKIAVFNGNTTTCIPSEVGNGRDHIFEQALPVDSWGQQFAITTSQGRARDVVKVTSSGDENSVKRNGQVVATLNRGESFEFSLFASEGSCFIETTQPSVVYLYNTTGEEPYEPSGSNNGDPSMAWIPPVEQRIDEITFCTFNSDYEFASIAVHYVNIVVYKDNVDQVYLDGNQIDANEFEPVVGTSDYRYVRKEITHGTHHLSCNMGLIAHVYGFGYARGYAYCVGANVLKLTQKLLVNGLMSEFYHHGLYMCIDDSVDLAVEANYAINRVNWTFGDGQIGEGQQVTYQYGSEGNYVATAYINGTNAFSMETVYDTMSVTIHVGGPTHYDETHVVCDVDSFEYFGEEYTESGYFERVGTNIYGCDSTYILTLDMEFTPYFEFVGTHWPIGGSETFISVNEYAIRPTESRTHVDTVLWQIDCPNWRIEPHGSHGMNCTLYIHSYLLEPVTLHAWAINRCDTVHEEFFIQTSYFGFDELSDGQAFKIYPNPSGGQLTMQFGDLSGGAEVMVYNAMGQRVDSFSVDTHLCHELTYQMPDLPNGLYYFMMDMEGKKYIQKISIIRW